jgi:excisionase family DNA binding protein
MPESTDWLTVDDVAPLLGIAAKTVYQMAAQSFPEARRIPSYRLGPRGGKLRFLRGEIEGYVKALRPVPKPTGRVLTEHTPRKAERRRPRP